jgi:Flp pilus assembly protein TadD
VARYGWGAAAVATLIALVPITRLYRAEALRWEARQLIEQGIGRLPGEAGTGLKQAELSLQRALDLHVGNAAAWSDLAFTLEMQARAVPARARELAPAAERAARRALQGSVLVPEFWIRLGVALDMQRRFAEAEEGFQRAVQLAPNSSQAWYYYAYHLSLNTKDRQGALHAVANCLSLDPGNHAAEALRTKLNERL